MAHRNLDNEFDAEASCGYNDCDEHFEGPFAELRKEKHMALDHGDPWEEIAGWPRPPEQR